MFLHDKVGSYYLKLSVGKMLNFSLHCMLIKINTSLVAGGCAPDTLSPLHLGSTTNGNPLSKFLDPPLYHKITVVYAYKGQFNRNIDYNWSGAILLHFQKIVDKCTKQNGVQPVPENNFIVDLNLTNGHDSFTSPGDC